MTTTITVQFEGGASDVAANVGERLSDALFSAGWFTGVPLCAGVGRCGLCRVRFLSTPPAPLPAETRRLSAAEVEAGWRLSCLRRVAPDMRLALPPAPEAPGFSRRENVAAEASLLLGVDLGTTGLAWRAVADGRVVYEGARLNPQLGAGSEVMSRLAFAASPQGRDRLRGLILDALREITAGAPGPVERMAVAGNPTMTYLLLGRDVSGLAFAPYRLDYMGGDEAALAGDLPPAYIPPLLGPFVGADLTAGLAAVRRQGAVPPYLLADLGTNGEFVLALDEDAYLAASAPMGPSLEGVGLRNGRMAAPGAAVAFDLAPTGLAPVLFGGERGRSPDGVTGSGYLSLLAGLRRTGVLREDGGFASPDAPELLPIGRRILNGLANDGGEARLELGGVVLYASDVEEVLKVKAAFNAALSRLFAESGLASGALTTVLTAGALGEHVATADLEELGFLPPGLGGRVRAAGNSSLDGALLLLQNPEARALAEAAAKKTRILELARGKDFESEFVRSMVFRHVS